MKKFLLLGFLAIISTAEANGPWYRAPQDYKFPSQAILDHYTWSAPALGSGITILNAGALNNGSATTFTTFAAQPDFARNVVLTPGGSTAAIGQSVATVTGTDIFGKTMTESIPFGRAQSAASTGILAFKTITSVTFPAGDTTSGFNGTLTIVAGTKLGLTRCSSNAGDYVFAEVDGAYESTRGTYAVGAGNSVKGTTFSPNTAMNGSKNVDLFYVQNFKCYGY